MGKELQKGRSILKVIDMFILLVVVKGSPVSKCAVSCTLINLNKAVKKVFSVPPNPFSALCEGSPR